jgi:dTDP-4-dehydrorhamnose reductase
VNILVFGKDGQLGKALKVLFNRLPSSANLHLTYLGRAECDLSREAEVFSQLNTAKADLIINASAYTAVDKAETEIDLAYAVNAKAPELMARYAEENNATFLHYSTDYVFDGSKDGFYIETDTRNPLGVYGKSKAAGEEAIEAVFANSSKGQFAIFRTSWVYGDGGNFIRKILHLAKDREELKVIHDQHGVPTSAEWLAQVSLDLTLDSECYLKQFPSGIYHAVPAGETTWHGLASFAVQAAQNAGVELRTKPEAIKPILAVEYPLLAPRPMNSCMSTEKLRRQLSLSEDMPKLGLLKSPWSTYVHRYVHALVKSGLI